MHAQEIADSLQVVDLSSAGDTVTVTDSSFRQTACVPVMSTAEDSLVFQAGEKLEFALQYNWGALYTDVGYANKASLKIRVVYCVYYFLQECIQIIYLLLGDKIAGKG